MVITQKSLFLKLCLLKSLLKFAINTVFPLNFYSVKSNSDLVIESVKKRTQYMVVWSIHVPKSYICSHIFTEIRSIFVRCACETTNANLILWVLQSWSCMTTCMYTNAALCDADVDDFLHDRTSHDRREFARLRTHGALIISLFLLRRNTCRRKDTIRSFSNNLSVPRVLHNNRDVI